jgi:hypothetical protein
MSEFLIDGILPANEVHLLAGSSGSGKTTFLFQTLAAWQEGHPVLGHASYPVPYAYLSADRSSSSVNRTLQRLGLEDRITRMVCREHLPAGLTMGTALQEALSKYPDSKAFFIEGFQTMAGDRGNSYTPVAALLSATTAFCAKEGLTIVGVCHSPKIKADEKFQHSREVVLGSVAWAAYSDTVIAMDQAEDTGIITVKVLPRNAAKEEFQFVFGPNGVLMPFAATKGGRAELEMHLYSLAVGTLVTRQEMLDLGVRAGVKTRTVDSVIDAAVSEGVLERVTGLQGTYRRTPDSVLH